MSRFYEDQSEKNLVSVYFDCFYEKRVCRKVYYSLLVYSHTHTKFEIKDIVVIGKRI